MIFPILNGLRSWRSAPITWTLVLLNLLVLTFTTVTGFESQTGLEDLMKQKYFTTAQGRIYAQYLANSDKSVYPEFLLELGRQVNAGRPERAAVLGQLAYRDLNFMNAAESIDFEGDQVAFRLWKKNVAENS